MAYIVFKKMFVKTILLILNRQDADPDEKVSGIRSKKRRIQLDSTLVRTKIYFEVFV